MSAENALSAPHSDTTTTLARKSWTAYVGVVALGLFLLAIVVPIAWRMSMPAGAAALIVVLSYLTYRILTLRSFHLYYDDVGVWLYSGIFPWSRGIAGVKWRDIDEAVFFQGLWSWLFKSYTVRVGHRFTKASELVLPHMARGHDAAMHVNSVHQDLMRAEKLN